MKSFFLPLVFSAFLTLVATATADDHQKGEAPLQISHGAEVKLTDYLVPGKTTIFDFSSQYCPPCRAISPKLDALHKKRDDIAVVKVDINRAETKKIDWQSPVAQQYKLHSIPHFKVFSPEGKLIAEGDKASELVEGWVE